MTSVKVKICGLTRAEDITAAVRCGADALGFVFVPGSKRCISVEAAAFLVDRVPAFVDRVGLFQNQAASDVKEVLDRVALSLLQFHGDEDAAFCSQFGRPWIKAVRLVPGQTVAEQESLFPRAAAILVDSHEPGGLGGTGKTLDWNRIQAGVRPLILAGGLEPHNVAQAIRLVHPWAVDVSSGVEVSPGVKDAGLIKRFIDEAKK